MNSFNVLLTDSAGVYVERSARDYTVLIAPDCTPWHGVAGYNKNSNTCANSHSYLLYALFTVLVPLSWRCIMKTVAIESDCDVLVADKYDKYTISDRM